MTKYTLIPLLKEYFLVFSSDKDNLLRTVLNLLLSESFFFLTQESDGWSLLAEKERLKGNLHIDEGNIYLGIQLLTDNPGLNEIGMLSEISECLSKYNIPILCQSTFNCNYIFYPIEYQNDFLKMIKENSNIFQLEET